MKLLSARFFGHFSATVGGLPVSTLQTTRLQALFAYLLLHPHVIFRQHLAYLFWPDSSEGQARTNLRNLIHLLRQALPDFDHYIRADPQTLQWRADAPCRLDVREFEQHLALSLQHPLDRDRLEQAVGLYQGDLLPECYDDWIVPERERLRRAYLQALEALAELTENARDYPAALRCTHRLLQEEPLHATANRQLMRLHALTGNSPAALKAYQAYVELLERELGIQPEQPTQDLYARIKNPLEGASPVSAGSGQVVLVGRQAEWSRLQAAWRKAAAGSPQAVFVTGEAGIGKTRLVEELVQWAARQGLRTAVANCYPAEGSLPYAPVVSWLRSRPLPALDQAWLAEISRLLPEALEMSTKLAVPQPFSETWQRQRMFEALARAVLGDQQPALLVIEDIHWCDQDTLEWLHYLMRFNPRAPLLLLLTERSEERSDLIDALKKMQSALTAEEKYTEIQLQALDETDCLELAAQVAQDGTHQGLRPEFAAQIFQETEGNPLFIVEMVRLGTQAQPAHASATLPEKVQTVLQRRIAQLSAPTRELASLAATLGREFRLDVLQQASGLDERELVQALDEMLLRQIVHEQAPDRYDFTHDKLRQTVFSGLSSAHRRLLHRRAAEAYQKLDGDAPQTRSAEIARHYEAAGLALPAIIYYRLAAEAAARLFSTADAIHNLERAVELSKAAGGEVPGGIVAEKYAGLLEKMGDLLALDGKYPQAQASFERALALRADAPGMWRSQVYRKLADALTAQYQHDLAHTMLDQAEQALQYSAASEDLAETQEWLQVQLARIQMCYWNNIPKRMEEIIQKISPTLEAVGRMDQKIAMLNLQCQARMRRESYITSQETVNISRRRLRLAETQDDPYDLAVAQFQYGFCLLWHDDLAQAQVWMQKGFAATERVGARLWYLRVLTYLGVLYRKLNDLSAVREYTRELLELAPQMNEYTYHGIGQANQGWLAWRDGDAAQAERLCHDAIEMWGRFGGNVFQGLAYWVLLAVALARRDLNQAEKTAQALLDPNPMYRPVEASIAAVLIQAVDACQAQDADAACTLFAQAVEKAKAAREL